MTSILPDTPVSPLRQKLIDDMNMRHFSLATQRTYIRDVERFATFLRRSLNTATTEDVRQLQLAQSEAGVEGVLGSRLPRSADRPQFWANTVAEARHVQREAWQQAHYNAFLIADARAVRFVPHTR